MLPKPSLVLQVGLVPECYSEAAVAEIKRSYMYLAQSVVRGLEGDEASEGNLMRLSIRLMKPYWDASDAAAQQLWDRSFMPWLANAARNMSTAMHNYNTVLHPLGCGMVEYGWADFDFGPNGVLRVKVDDENRITPEAPLLCDRFRALSGQGSFGQGVRLVRTPSVASLETQRQAAEEARRAAAQAAEDAPAQEDGACQPEGDQDAAEAPQADLPCPAPVLDFSQWGIEYEDGSVEELDSRAV